VSALALHRIMTADPTDTSGLVDAVKNGLVPSSAVAVVGKTEGNGCVNDFTRGMAADAWKAALPVPVVTIMSGGTEGVLSPHVIVLASAAEDPACPPGALVIGTGRSVRITPGMLGRRAQVDAVATAVRRICAANGIAFADVHLALVKCPLLTSADIGSAPAGSLVADDTYESMAASRAASALGTALALGEITDGEVEAGLRGDRTIYSRVASASAGVEVDRCEVVVLGHNPKSRGRLRAAHAVMADALDATPVQALLRDIEAQGGRTVHLFAKAEADPTGNVRGRRHTMLTDSDIHSTRHARAALGGLLAGLAGEPAIYVSGGAEHQGPPGGGPVTVIWEVSAVPRRPSTA
jgi:cyanuric acid amidohydrolase